MNEEIVTRIKITGIMLLMVLVIGTFGYYYLTDEQHELFNCFYMTVITITTIGYGEIINIKDYPGARIFTIFLAFAGIGILTYFVSFVSAMILEGHLTQTYKKKKMERDIKKLQDHYIICGISNHSFHLIEELNTTSRKNVFIEIDDSVIHEILKKFPAQHYIIGDAASDEILEKAGIKSAKGLFAATNQDNLNLVICFSARRLNPDIKIVSLCTDHLNMNKIKLAGADNVVSPNYIGGLRMASEMLRPAVTGILDVMLRGRNKNLRFEQVNLTDKQEGKKIGELKFEDFKDTILIAVKSNDEVQFKPDDDFVVKKGDSLILMTTPEERMKLEDFA